MTVDILSILLALFDNRLDSLGAEKARHASERLFRVTGDKKYIKYIESFFTTRYLHHLEILQNFSLYESVWISKGYEEVEKFLQKKRSGRMRRRYEFFLTMPEYKFLQTSIWILYKIQDNSLTHFPKETVACAYKQVKNINWGTYLYNKELLYFDPVQTVNLAYYLNWLIGWDGVQNFIDLCEELPDTKADDFINKMYMYTHILLCESRYYQTRITNTPRVYKIMNILSANLNKIMVTEHLDLITEVGVCFNLVYPDREVVELIQIRKKINKLIEKVGGIPDDDGIFSPDLLDKLEHRNILAVLLNADLHNLHSGPTIQLTNI